MILRMEFLQESPEGMCDVLSVPYLLRTTEGAVNLSVLCSHLLEVFMNQQLSYEEFLTRLDSFILTEKGNCPVTSVLQLLQGKWKMQIIYLLCVKSPMRFGEFRKFLPGLTNTMLTNALRELEGLGIVRRKQFNEIPPHVEYSLTEKGLDLLPVFHAILNWGMKYVP